MGWYGMGRDGTGWYGGRGQSIHQITLTKINVMKFVQTANQKLVIAHFTHKKTHPPHH
jgi:hypothetical protein